MVLSRFAASQGMVIFLLFRRFSSRFPAVS